MAGQEDQVMTRVIASNRRVTLSQADVLPVLYFRKIDCHNEKFGQGHPAMPGKSYHSYIDKSEGEHS
jgi:hypothetical protein